MKNLLAIAALCCAFTPLHAQDNGALWTNALAQLEASRKWEAGEVETVSDIEKGGQQQHVVASLRLRGWEKGKPMYELVRREPADKKASAQDLDDTLAILDVSDMLARSKPTRTDGQSLDGAACAVFETRLDEGLKKGAVKLWVDTGTGALRQMTVAARVPLMVDATVTVHYSAGPQGQPLPDTRDYVLEVLMPFRHATVRLKQSNRAWVAKPAG